MIDLGHRGMTYPLVAGLDGCGIIKAIGSEVRKFKVADEVVALFAAGDRGGSFQEFAVVDETKVAKKMPEWSFDEAASLGYVDHLSNCRELVLTSIRVCYFTAVMGLGIGLQVPLPFIKDGPSGFMPSSVLVLGGSSALGAAAIQLLRLAVPTCKILVTSSPKHHGRITEYLGADHVFDRNSASLVEDVKSSTEHGNGVDSILDTVGAANSAGGIFDTLDPGGRKRYAQVWTGEDEVQVPDGVESVLFRSRDFGQLQGGSNIMDGLQRLLEQGKYKLPLPVRNVGTGAEGLNQGLDLMRNGVSGEKLVVSV